MIVVGVGEKPDRVEHNGDEGTALRDALFFFSFRAPLTHGGRCDLSLHFDLNDGQHDAAVVPLGQGAHNGGCSFLNQAVVG